MAQTKKFTNQQVTEFYTLYFDRIYRYFYYKLLSQELAEDLTGDTFLAFAEQLHLNKVHENPRAFLYGIANHKLNDFLRHKYKLPIAEVPVENIQAVAEIDEFVVQQEKLTPEEKIQQVLHLLPPQQREIIELRMLEKLTLSEVVEKIGKDMSYVKTTQNRAIKKLKNLLRGIPETTNNVEETQNSDPELFTAEPFPVTKLD